MEKVFSIEAFKQNPKNYTFETSMKVGWPQRCEGLTAKEMTDGGWNYDEAWLVAPKSKSWRDQVV